MAYSYVDYTGDGSTTDFTVTFDYLNQSDVGVEVDGAALTSSDFSWLNDTTIRCDSAPTNGAEVRIYRVSSRTTREVDFSSGAVLTEDDLDRDSKHAFFLCQEAIDAVTGGSIAVGSIGASELDDGAVGTSKLADASVSTDKIQDGAVTADKLATGAVSAADVTFSATGNIASTTVQAAIAEVDTEKLALSTFTTKGDLGVATASATVSRLGVGTNGQVLTADSTQSTGVKWATPTVTSGSPLAKAWVTFTVSGTTVTVRSSYNVTSVTRNSTGYYTLVIPGGTLADAYPVIAGSVQRSSSTSTAVVTLHQTVAVTTTSIPIVTVNEDGNVNDYDRVSVVIFGA